LAGPYGWSLQVASDVIRDGLAARAAGSCPGWEAIMTGKYGARLGAPCRSTSHLE
jgi:hypothetical protein